MHRARLHPREHRAHSWALLGCMAAAVAVLGVAVTGSDVVAALDAAAAGLARTEWLASTSGDLSALAATDIVLPATVMAVALLALARRWHGAVTVALAVLATQGVVHLVKLLVARPRPEANDGLTAADGYSFPSAHSATAVALYATLALVAAGHLRGAARAAVLVGGGAVVVAVGLSRVQLGAHYPVDVVAGWLTGGVLVLASWTLVARLVARPAPAPAPAASG